MEGGNTAPLDINPRLFTERESNELNASIINSHSKSKFCFVNAAIICSVVVLVIMLLFCCKTYVQNVYLIEDSDSDDEEESSQYNTDTRIDATGALVSIVTENGTNRRVADIRKSRTGLVENKKKILFGPHGKRVYEVTSEINYKDNTFKEIVSEKHSTFDLIENIVVERKELTNTDGVINMTVKNIVSGEMYNVVMPKTGTIENSVYVMNADESMGKLKYVQLLTKSGNNTVHVYMVPDKTGVKIEFAERKTIDQHGNVINHENITTEVDRMYISNFTSSPSKSGFTGDLPALSANVNIETDDYATAAMKMSLESGIYDQQKKYVADRNRFSNVSGYSSERDDPNNLIPWMGLRPPVYGKNLVEKDARTVPSEQNDDQMTNHKQIRWN